VGDAVKFACVDGPDFDGHQVDFGDLMMRLRRYADAEKAALERWSEACRMKNYSGPSLPDPLSLLGERPRPLDPLENVKGG
jgi:hypothetical protein